MYATKLKTNARKSTHSGKVRLGVSSLHDRHWQDVSGCSSSQGSQEGKLGIKLQPSSGLDEHFSKGAPPSSKSKDRSIWDTKFTESQLIPPDDLIWASQTPTLNLKPLAKLNVEEYMSSPKSESDRNIFSALVEPNSPGKKAPDSRSPPSLHGISMHHQSSNTSRKLSSQCGRSSKDFVFKKPTAPPPVSRIYLSGSGSSERGQKKPTSCASTPRSGLAQSRQRNNKRVHASETVRSGSSARSKKLQHSFPLSRPPMSGISTMFAQKQIISTSNVFTELGFIDTPRSLGGANRKSPSLGDSLNIEELEAYMNSHLDTVTVQLKNIGEISPFKANKSSIQNKLGKVTSKCEPRSSNIASHKTSSRKPTQHVGRNVKPISVKSIRTKSTGKQSATRGHPSETMRKSPATSSSKTWSIIDLCQSEPRQRSLTQKTARASPQNKSSKAKGEVQAHLKANRTASSSKIALSHIRNISVGNSRTLNVPSPSKTQSTVSTTKYTAPPKALPLKRPSKPGLVRDVTTRPSQEHLIKNMPRKDASKNQPQKKPFKNLPLKNSIKSLSAKISIKALPQQHPVKPCPPEKHPNKTSPPAKHTNKTSPPAKHPNKTSPPAKHPNKTSPLAKHPNKTSPLAKHTNKTSPPEKHPNKTSPPEKSHLKSLPGKLPIKNLLHKDTMKCLPPKKPTSCDAENESTTLPKPLNNSDSSINHGYESTVKGKVTAPQALNRLEVHLSSVKMPKADSGEYDDIDGILFASFGTQSELESYLSVEPDRSLSMSSPSVTENPSDCLKGRTISNQKQLEQYQQQLIADVQRHSNREVLHPKLVRHGFSVRKDLIEKGIISINLRALGMRFGVKKRNNIARSRQRARLVECRKHSKTTELKSSIIKERCATPTTGLKIKFTIPGRKSTDTKTSSESEALPSKTSQVANKEVNSEVSKGAKKLPVEESFPFKPFEKQVLSSKSAFVSDALDKYLQEEERHAASATLLGHPLLQSKTSSVSFNFPSKQSSYVKTLHTALQERQMAKLKSRVPTVAETAEKLAKNLKHMSDTFKISGQQAEPKVKEVQKISKKPCHSDLGNTLVRPDAVTDKEIKDIPMPLDLSKKHKEANLDEKKRLLEEKLENVKKKLKESNAFMKKSPPKSKSQTSWTTRLKIVNSRLVQQLSAPGRNAHLIKAKEDGWKSSQQNRLEVKTEGNASKSKSVDDAKTDTLSRKRKTKNKMPSEFVRLDQQTKCTKDYCHLGCICDSINLNLPVEKLTKHCRKAACMFECTCQRSSIRILRNRRRPTIFQEKSMLFYDGVGMFSNSNTSCLDEFPGSDEQRDKTGILGPNRGLCARAVVYKRKRKARAKDAQTELSQPGQSVPAAGVPQPQGLSIPKQVVGSLTSAQNPPVPNAKEEQVNLPGGLPKGPSGVGMTGNVGMKANDVIPSVLYTPVKVPLTGLQGSVILYAPVNSLPYMVQKVNAPLNQQKAPSQEGNGNRTQLLTADYFQPGILQVKADPKTSDNRIKPVAVISPSTTSPGNLEVDKILNTSASATSTAQCAESKSSIEVNRNCKACQALQSRELSVVFKSSIHEALNKVHTCSKGTDKSPKESNTLEKIVDTNSTVNCPSRNQSDDSDSPDKSPKESNTLEKIVDTNSTVNCPSRNQSDDSDSPQCALQATTTNNVTCSPTASGKESCYPEALSSKITPETEMPANSLDSQDLHDGSKSDNPTSATTTAASTEAVQIPDVSENAQEAPPEVQKTIRAVVTRTKSPVRSPTTSPAERLLPTMESTLKARDGLKAFLPPLTPSSSDAVKDLTKQLETAPESQEQVNQTVAKTNITGKPALTVPAFSYTTRSKTRNLNKPKLTKTQVFLPGTSMSKIGKTGQAPQRSPLLIEIQSECDWSETKNNILSTIAKHTATNGGAPGIVRVGKFLIEILNKGEQKNISLPTSSSKAPVQQTAPIMLVRQAEALTPGNVPNKATSKSSSQTDLRQATIKAPQVPQTPCPTKSSVSETKTCQIVPYSGSSTQVNFAGAGTLTASTPSGRAPLLSSSYTDLRQATIKAPQLSQTPCPTLSSVNETKTYQHVPYSGSSTQVNFANTGTLTASIPSGRAPLLTVLPPGSILLSDGKNPAGYLVPLAAVQDQLRGAAAAQGSPAQGSPSTSKTASGLIQSMAQIVGTNTATISSKLQGSTVGSSQSETSTPSSSSPGDTAAPLVAKSDGSTQGANQGTAVTPDSESVKQQSQPTGECGSRQLLQIEEIPVSTTAETSGVSSSSGNLQCLAAVAPSVANSLEEFIDVESLAGLPPLHLPTTRHRPNLLKPAALQTHPIFPVALTSEAPTASSMYVPIAPKIPRLQDEHRFIAPEHVHDPEDEEVDVVSCDDSAEVPRIYPAAKIATEGSSQGSRVNKRKRKSPVVEKQSAIVFEEPEFIESYYEVSSGEDEEEDTRTNAKRDKPNKVMHLIKERQRRRDQRDLFGGLKLIMVNDKDSKIAKNTILALAFKEIKLLESRAFSIEIERTKLNQENYQKRSKLASLLGLNIVDYPAPFPDEKDPNFEEYLKELHDGSEGMASSAQSETTSQDSESLSMDFSDAENETEEVFNQDLFEEITDDEPNHDRKAEDCYRVDTSNDADDDPTSATILGKPARHHGLPMTVPTPTAASPRRPSKSKFSKGSRETPTAFKSPVPVTLTALPFDFNLMPLNLTTSGVTDSGVPSLDPVVTNHASGDFPETENYTEDSVGENQPEPASVNLINSLPSSNEDSSEKDPEISGTFTQSASLTALRGLVDKESEIEETAESNNRTTYPSLTPSDSSNERDVVEASKKDTDVSEEMETCILPEQVVRGQDDLSNTSSMTAQDNVQQESQHEDDRTTEDALECDDDVELINFNTGPNSEVIVVDDDATKCSLPTSNDDGVSLRESTASKPDRKKPAPPADPSGGGSPPLVVLSIETKGGVVSVTCDNGEVIPLALVKASCDGTMQVAVEGDISSEKVEELLSKTEVMECLEKVADDACET